MIDLRFQAPTLRKSALALALLAAFSPALAEDDAAEDKSEGQVSVGVGALTGRPADRALFGQYSGLRRDDAVGLFGFDTTRLDGKTGATLRLQGNNLGLDTRELGLFYRVPADWKVRAEYSELVRRDPLTVKSFLAGAGSTNPQVLPVAPGSGPYEIDLRIKRTDLGLAFTKEIGTSAQVDLGVKWGRREGARLFGIGMNCPSPVAPGCAGTTGTAVGWATLMLPEPIDAQHTQFDARVSFGGDKLSLSAGYYGSFYRNAFETLTAQVPGSLNNAAGTLLPLSAGLQSILSQPIALAPDNESNEFDVTAVYAVTPTTRLSFKAGYGVASQSRSFASANLTDAPAASLGGSIDTTTLRLGLSARPVQKMTVHADARYRERNDNTQIAAYNVEGTTTYTNRQLPNTRIGGKVDVAWQFNADYRGLLGVNYEHIDRGVFTPSAAIAGTSALRQRTYETTYRAELRRRLSEQFSGAVSYETSSRSGSNWLKDNSGLGVTEVNGNADPTFATAIFMPTLADRQRDTGKLRTEWQPTDDLLVQFGAEAGRDRYTSPSVYGLRNTNSALFSIDLDASLTAVWHLTGNLAVGKQKLLQARPGESFIAFDNTTSTVGVGLTGKVAGVVRVGGDVAHINDVSRYAQSLDQTAGAGSVALLNAAGGLPDIVFRQTRVTLFSEYDIDKRSTVRLNVIYQHSKWNDWTWGYNDVAFVYADGSTVTQKPVQEAAFFGAVYTYRWK